jgi:methionyl-tRNA formyltransferase
MHYVLRITHIANSSQSTTPLKIAYFGSPNFSAAFLTLLREHAKQLNITIDVVFTQPNRPAGRKLLWQPTPVKKACQEASIPVYDKPLKENLAEIIELLKKHQIDLAVLFAFNEIIPDALLHVPKYGFWNIHPSLLPKYRGPSPVSYPLLLGDTTTGVTLMQMDTKMDTGDIVGQVEFPFEENDTQSTVLNKIPSYAIDLVRKHVQQLGQEAYTKQDESQATYTRKLKREDGYVELSVLQKLLHQERLSVRTLPIISEYYGKNPSYTPPEYITQNNLFQLWKGLHPWPGVWTLMQTAEGEKRLKIIGMQIVDGKPAITQVQMEGRNVVSLKEFQASDPGILT